MKRVTLLTLSLVYTLALAAQGVVGSWSGTLEAGANKLPILFHITEVSKSIYSATMDSPAQGVKGLPATISVEREQVELTVSVAQLSYSATLKGDELIGTFKQGTAQLPLTLQRLTAAQQQAAAKPHRPQEPQPPFPYHSQEVTFLNEAAGITLGGTLTLPLGEGKFPAAILISGSGPQNRDEELMGHKPFWVIADYLTRHGIAVLRYDDRGVGASKGDFAAATSADFATDVASAMQFLSAQPQINANQIGLIGHSEGGIIAPMVATTTPGVAWIVLLAAPGVRGDELMLKQQEMIAKQRGASEEQIKMLVASNRSLFDKLITTEDRDELKQQLTAEVLETLPPNSELPDAHKQLIEQMTSPWMHYFVRYNPAPALEKVSCPLLALNGEKDKQVSATQNLTAIEQWAKKGGNNQVTCKRYPELNHLFQHATTGDITEYAAIEETISPQVLSDIASWITERCK